MTGHPAGLTAISAQTAPRFVFCLISPSGILFQEIGLKNCPIIGLADG
jgi:hypothetical protein